MNTYLILKLGSEFFAVPVKQVLEVLQKQQITPVPKTPEHILGIINFRGDILPVIDTRLKFNIQMDAGIEKQVVIVYEIQNIDDKVTLIAATADAVKDVIEINEQEIKPVPALGLSFDNRFINGAIYRNNAFIILLDIVKVFSAADLESVQQLQSNITESI